MADTVTKEDTLVKARRILKDYDGPKVRIMEVCGTHTHEIFRQGVRRILSPKIEMISGPGCPVCVTDVTLLQKILKKKQEQNPKQPNHPFFLEGEEICLAA